MHPPDPPHPYFRTDLLTGSLNLLQFSEALSNNFGNHRLAPLSLVALDICDLRGINARRGHDFGDQVLRWMTFCIKDLISKEVYRISGDDFIAVLIGETHQAHVQKARALFDKINRDSAQLGLSVPLARITVFNIPEGVVCNPALI